MTKTAAALVAVALTSAGWLGGSVVLAGSALACTPTPGAQPGCSSDAIVVSPQATVVNSANGTITSAPNSAGNTIVASYTENVYRDPANTLCGQAGQCLTWVLQVTNTQQSTDPIDTVTVSNFAGYTVNVGYAASGAPGMTDSAANAQPTYSQQSSNSQVIRWVFSPEVNPGSTTRLLVVQTNSTTDTAGTVSVQDGVSGSGPGLSPAVLPEMGLPAAALAVAAVGGAAVVRRRRSA